MSSDTSKNTAIKQFKYMGKFKCIADKCPDHCCYGWDVSVDEKTYKLYKNKAPELLKAVVSDGDDHSINKNGKDNSCIMMKDGLCGMQCKYGIKYMGDTCLLYPRIRNKIDNTIMVTASLSCPEIVRICLYEDDPFGIEKGDLTRLSISAYIPTGNGYSKDTILNTNQILIKFCDNKNISVESLMMQIISIAQQLEELPKNQWLKKIFLLSRESINYDKVAYSQENLYRFLRMIVGLNYPKRINRKRLYQVLDHLEKALEIKLDFENAKIIPSKKTSKIYQSLLQNWSEDSNLEAKEILRKYIKAHLAMRLFPYGKPSTALTDQIKIFALKFIFIKLNMMLYMHTEGTPLTQDTIIMIIQSISRWLDHTNLDFFLPKCKDFDLDKISNLQNMILES